MGMSGLHAVIVPFPAQGTINPLINLAQLLSSRGVFITFVNTEWSHKCISKAAHNDDEPAFKFLTIPDGLPPDHGRLANLGEYVIAMENLGASFAEQLVRRKNSSNHLHNNRKFHVLHSPSSQKTGSAPSDLLDIVRCLFYCSVQRQPSPLPRTYSCQSGGIEEGGQSDHLFASAASLSNKTNSWKSWRWDWRRVSTLSCGFCAWILREACMQLCRRVLKRGQKIGD
ncbi:gallate 1-beta-glucosyltransferase-like [Cryptomeria japonica]|uniref:gallate 1-beta-glucosyltransferase-like n=1 Tax=Cryptomeria japonica TaxID=3369 RepID=UPI0027DA4AE6|nr:gallate 1-beta-glucosyltransferase-like [Cryptomeria japonica]